MWAARAAHRGARRVAQRTESLSVASALRSNLPSRSTTSGSIVTASSSRVRSFVGPSRHVSFAPPNPIIPAAYVAGSIASRTVLATARMNAANRVFNAVTTPSARARLRDALLGRTRSGSVTRVAVVATGAGVVAHVYTEEVPATGRRRLMLLDLGDEERLLRAATAAQFERLDGSFLPPSHPATQRVAGILWKLVNRLDPALVVGTNPKNLSHHPLLAEGATWSLHVYDSPEVNASVAPGGHIFVSTGLIRACGRDDGRLAFVLAHEMGHRIARHVAEHASIEMLRTMGVAVGWALAAMFGADFLGGAVTASAMVGAEAAAELAVSLPYSRTMEYEADEIGMRLLTGACFDPDAGPRMMSTLEAFAVEQRRLAERESSSTRDGSFNGVQRRSTSFNGDDERARKEMERYLSTHPLNEERIAAMRERIMPRLFESASNSDCGAYVAALQSSMGLRHRRLPPNAHDANKGKVFIPTSKWRARYVRELDVTHSTERGMNRVLDRRNKMSSTDAANAGDHGAMTGPLGRFDDRRMRALLARPDTEAGAKAREDAAALGSKGMHSRGWRGPVRRKVELSKASASDGVEASPGVRDEASRGDAEEGTELGELVGMYWSGSGARRAVRRAAAA
ncbi:predicted protein [Micromonas commoda]|uniref:Peptidase M48 domain-containing protein n=1 Tax=Micromonas commoda (strain RCC299 / NOUM17 / CCMP2709) TaxID=296587 RepID=C1E127_MICCC|nr:predicted protein [Micromonas commoda]ACO62102.1 predicted protein [Micromonas commoda]|eukprot:XP_002500844.1 predicted protein [Micromonas commoda]